MEPCSAPRGRRVIEARRNEGHLVELGGEGGEGVISCGEMLTTALARRRMTCIPSGRIRRKSRATREFQVRASDANVLSQGQEADILITFNEEAYQLHGKNHLSRTVFGLRSGPLQARRQPLNPTRCRSMKSL